MSEWVAISERLPTAADANEHDRVWIAEGDYVGVWPWPKVHSHKRATHWHAMPKRFTPEPPELGVANG